MKNLNDLVKSLGVQRSNSLKSKPNPLESLEKTDRPTANIQNLLDDETLVIGSRLGKHDSALDMLSLQ
jgi:hypothetical protein